LSIPFLIPVQNSAILRIQFIFILVSVRFEINLIPELSVVSVQLTVIIEDFFCSTSGVFQNNLPGSFFPDYPRTRIPRKACPISFLSRICSSKCFVKMQEKRTHIE